MARADDCAKAEKDLRANVRLLTLLLPLPISIIYAVQKLECLGSRWQVLEKLDRPGFSICPSMSCARWPQLPCACLRKKKPGTIKSKQANV